MSLAERMEKYRRLNQERQWHSLKDYDKTNWKAHMTFMSLPEEMYASLEEYDALVNKLIEEKRTET